MNEVILVLVMYCGTPVAATVSIPEGEGYKVSVGPIERGDRQKFLDAAKTIIKEGGKVQIIKVEEQAGVKCGKEF